MTYADPNKPYEVCETEKKTFIVPVGWKRENVRTFILLCLSFIAGEVAGYAYRDAFDFVTDNSDEDGDILCDEFDLYEQFKCTGRMRREERGIITRHGINKQLAP